MEGLETRSTYTPTSSIHLDILTIMEYAHYPSYSPRDWQDAMYTDASVDPASYRLLAVGYPAQPNMAAQHQHELMVCSSCGDSSPDQY